ncbi:MAG TPA: hypothetical protein VJU13_04790 [Candidatus Nitrosocosmicus sp.]|nr:hypothetical protein [Candidatus Nitrosocosmicus sp.]
MGNQTFNGISLNHPHSSEIDNQGNIYITDQNNKRVVKFSPNGTYIMSWGEIIIVVLILYIHMALQ